MRKNIQFIALILLGAIFSTTVSATNLGSGKINTDNGNSISAQDNVVSKKFAVDVLDINGEYAEATIAGTASDYNVVVSRSNIETVSPINGKYSFILNETYAVSIDYEQSGSKHYSYFEFEIDNSGNVAYGNSMNNEAPLESGFSSSNVTRSARTIQESEPNDSYTTANRTYDDYNNYGLVSSYNDKDFWVVSFDYSGTANFWLGNIPANCNYDIAVYDSDLNFIEYSCNAGSAQELITIDVEANTNYYIYLVGYMSYNTSSQYWLRVKNYPNASTSTTWFSQKNSSLGTTWDSTNLTSLYFPNMSSCDKYCGGVNKCANTPFYTVPGSVAQSNQLSMGHINMFGCNVSSMATIFRNLGATTVNNKYDFRNGTTAKQIADPFTVTMANMLWPTITERTNGGTTIYEITSYTSEDNPTYTYWYNVCNAFGLTPHKVDLSGYEPDEKADIIAYYLEQNPEGVLVRVANSHSIVFTDTTHEVSSSLRMSMPEAIELTPDNQMDIIAQERQAEELRVASIAVSSTDYDGLFTCYDPGATEAAEGMGVPYDESYAADKYGGVDVINYIYYFD